MPTYINSTIRGAQCLFHRWIPRQKMILRQKYAVGFWVGLVTLDVITVVSSQLMPGMRQPPPPPPPPVITFGKPSPVPPSAELSVQPGGTGIAGYYRPNLRLTGRGRQTAALPVGTTPQKLNYYRPPLATQRVLQYATQQRTRLQYRPQNLQPQSTQYKSRQRTR